MLKRILPAVLGAAALAGCMTGFSEVAPRGGWRAEAERACMDRRAESRSGAVAESASFERAEMASIVELPAIVEDLCGIDYPLKVSAFVDGQTGIEPTAILGCPMTEALDAWLRESVQPAAIEWIGAPVIEIEQLSSYACRKRNNFGKGYSEHAFGNALDIAGFTFANGRKISMARDWRGSPEAREFLREIFATACQRFTTVLGPGSNIMHYNHIHVDLAIIAPDKSPKMCKPSPEVTPPPRLPVGGDLIAAAPPPAQPVPSGELPSVPVPATIESAIPGAD